MIQIYTDGATEGHNGKLGTVKFCGLGFYCPKYNYQHSERIEAISNNEAEFWALIKAMEWAISQNEPEVIFYLDSQIVINRANGRKFKKPNYRMDKFQNRVLELKKEFKSVAFTWIPRVFNKEADRLSKQCLQVKRSYADWH